MAKDYSSNSNSGYMLQLDSLRAIAVIGVVIHHYNPDSLGKLQLGSLGVRLFFILSGFLITGILLRQKQKIANSRQRGMSRTVIKNFFIRRCIRLMPAYYATIFISYILLNEVDILPIWHLTYLSNVYFSFNDFDSYTAHFWSLSVEAQFYLFWPFIILRNNKKIILRIIILSMFLSPIFRFFCLLLSPENYNLSYVFPLSCLDTLGIGSFIAYCEHYNDAYSKKIYKYFLNLCFWIGIPYFIIFDLTHYIDFNSKNLYLYGITSIFSNFFLAFIVYKASKRFKSLFGNIMEFEPLVYMGKISYGIYLYHLITPSIVMVIIYRFNLPLADSDLLRTFIFLLSTVFISALSWHFFENPINSLKSKFRY